MAVNERLMQVGSWDLQLLEDTPLRVLDRLTFFGLVVITPTRQGYTASERFGIQSDSLSVAQLLATSIYTGVYTGRRRRRTALKGYGPAYLLGTSEGLSDTYEADESPSARTVDSWVSTKILTDDNGSGTDALNHIVKGSIDGGATTKDADIEKGDTPLDVLNHVARELFDMDWRVNPDMTLDVDDEGDLFATTPTVIVSPLFGGRDENITGYFAVIDDDDDVEDFTTRVAVENTSGGVGSTDIGTNPYFLRYSTSGTPKQLDRSRFIDSPNTTSGNAAGHSAAILDRFDDTRRDVSVTIDAYDVRSDIEPGDSVYLYDPDLDLFDSANGVNFRGYHIHPEIRRCLGLSWSIRAGMGVYMIRSDAADPTVIDLTDYVQFETTPPRLQVGSTPRRIGLGGVLQAA